MKEAEITVEMLEQLGVKEQAAFIHLLAGAGAEQALRKIADSRWKESLWLRNYRDLGMDSYKNRRIEGLVFFLWEEQRENVKNGLRELFTNKEKNSIWLCPMEMTEKKMPFSVETKNRILLEINLEKYTIPFYLELRICKEAEIPPDELWLEDAFTGKNPVLYFGFPQEEYLALGLYQIIDKLELLNDFSWYWEVYHILTEESADGRKVRDSLAKMIEKKPIPSLEKRMDSVKAYADYGYMKKKWKNECKRREGAYPQWSEVIQLLTAFLTPLHEAILQDEIFFGDWMPHLGRYL